MEKFLEGLFSGAYLEGAQVNILTGEHATVNYNRNGKQVAASDSAPSKAAKDSILDYVDRLLPVVKSEYKESFHELWCGLLELREVKLEVYKKGKQQDTTFNRNLVAQIVHLLKERFLLPTANTVVMAECLEPGKGGDHPVRQKLGESPDKVIKKSVEAYISTKY